MTFSSTLILVPDPDPMAFRDWADQVYSNAQASNVPIPPAEEEWQRWAESVSAIPELAIYDIPRPEDYGADWKAWARDFMVALV